jgi:early secretory antigenic target protein ESAT-6
MKPLHVNFEAVETALTAIDGNVQTLTTTISQLEADMQPMLGSWTGEARDAYAANKATWDSAAADIVDLLSQFHGSIQTSYENYIKLYNETAQAWA